MSITRGRFNSTLRFVRLLRHRSSCARACAQVRITFLAGGRLVRFTLESILVPFPLGDPSKLERHGKKPMKSHRNQEVEVKLAVPDLAILRRRLATTGARKLGRVYERNALYDSPRHRLAKRGCLLRLRLETAPGKPAQAAHAVLTYTGPALRGGRYKVREEVEVPVPAPAQFHLILEAIGLQATFRYEKFRTSYRLPGIHGLNLELDETPIGVFLELEGPVSAIDRAAHLLGYGLADYITKSYRALYLDECRKRAEPAGDMLFPSRTNRQFQPVFP